MQLKEIPSKRQWCKRLKNYFNNQLWDSVLPSVLSFWTEWANSLLCCARFHIIMAKNITLFIYLLAPGLALQISKLSKWSYWNKDFFELLHLLEFTLNSVRFRLYYIYIYHCSLHSVGLAPFTTKVTWIWKETSASLQVIRWPETQQTPSGAAMNYLPSGNCKNQNYIKSNKKNIEARW